MKNMFALCLMLSLATFGFNSYAAKKTPKSKAQTSKVSKQKKVAKKARHQKRQLKKKATEQKAAMEDLEG
jgi:hypothetical protein